MTAPEDRPACLRRLPGGRRNRINVLLSDEENARLRELAGAARCSPQRFLLSAALAGDAAATAGTAVRGELLTARQALAVTRNRLHSLAEAPGLPAGARAEVRAAIQSLSITAGQLDSTLSRIIAVDSRQQATDPSAPWLAGL